MSDEVLAVNLEFVLLGFAAKNGVVLENKTRFVWSGVAKEEESRGEAADAPANDDAVVGFLRVDDAGGFGIVAPVAHLVAGGEDVEGVAIGGAVVADAAVAGEFVFSGEELGRSEALEEQGA